MANTDKNILNNTQRWLDQNDRNHSWLANKLGISDVYMSQIFSQKRTLLPKYIIVISELMDSSISELSKRTGTPEKPTYFLRGSVSNESGRKALVQALLDADRYVSLVANRKE